MTRYVMKLEKVLDCSRFLPADNIGVMPGVVLYGNDTPLCYRVFHI